MSKNMSSINVDTISYEYLLKARQETWENAEVIVNLFGPISLDDKSGKRKKKYRTWYKNTTTDVSNQKLPATNRGYPRGDGSSKGKMFFRLDYDKVINARVLLSDMKNDTNININRFPNELRSQSPALSTGTSHGKDVFTDTHFPSERPRGEIDNACTVCHKKFKCKSHLTRHLRTHTGEKPFSCPQCEKKFSLSSNLKKHLLVHSGIKEFSCGICHKAFTLRRNLKRHHRTHTGDKPFKCTECNAMFSYKGGLNVHMRTHTGETPYQCEICKKTFNDPSNLNSHILIHSDRKPFVCTNATCNKTFKRRRQATRHATRCSVKRNIVF